MADTELNAALRRMRFPGDMERRYQRAYFEKIIGPLRTGCLLALSILLITYLRLHFSGVVGVPDRYVLVPIAAAAFTWAASYHPRFCAVWQPAMSLGTAAVIVYTARLLAARFSTFPFYPNERSKLILFLFVFWAALVMMATFLRLQWRWTALMLALTTAGAHIVAAFQFHPPHSVWTGAFITGLFFLIPLLYASIALERTDRSDFLANFLLDAERQKSESLLLNILPISIAHRLKTERQTIADNFAEVAVLFADIVAFTPMSTSMPATELVAMLNEIFSAFDILSERHGLEKIKTIGDCYMVAGGLPDPLSDHDAAVAQMALDMQTVITHFRTKTGESLQLRIGINTGPVVAGVIGTKKYIYDLWGDTVNLASRMESHGSVGTIQVTEATYQRLQDRFVFGAARQIDVKGRGVLTAYTLLGRNAEALLVPLAEAD